MKLKLTLLICSMVFAYTFSIAQHGGLDNTFGTNGIVAMNNGVDEDCQGIAVQSDGKILLVGSTDNGTNSDLLLVRYNEDGTLDASFDGDGRKTIDLNGIEEGNSVVVLPDGKILVAGYYSANSNTAFLLFKINSDGSNDLTFGTNGRVVTDFGTTTTDIATNIMVTQAGKIVVAGLINISGLKNDFAAARYNEDGTPDNSFGTLGKTTFDIVEKDQPYSSVLQPDGKLILFGHIILAGNIDYVMIRCNENGTLDNSFGVGGIRVTDFSGGTDRGYSVALQQDGKIVAVGLADQATSNANLGVVRYDQDGGLDASFGVGGKVSAPVGTGQYESTNYVAIQSDGKILIAGTSTNAVPDGDDITLLRLNSNGSFDNTFGTNGIVTTDILSESNSSKGIAIQDDSKILVGGKFELPGSSNNGFSVVRYLSGMELGILDFSVANNSILVYPNPIQESAVFEYTLTNAETINIDLYDISGRLVQSFINSEERNKGTHREALVFDTSIPSGSYILTLSNGVGSSSVRVVK